MDFGVSAAGLFTGVLVGLTGMGGGALTMPLLTLVFGVPPLAAVSTDLVANAIHKPVGAVVHLGRKTVNFRLVGLLCIGSLPCAAIGAWIGQLLGGEDSSAQQILKYVTGVAVVLAAVTLFIRMYLDNARKKRGEQAPEGSLRAKTVPTIVLGAVAGLIVGTTSVGSGSIVIVCLLLLERRLTSSQLVGTDLVQAVPLVIVAAVGHLFVGEVDFGLVASLLLGSLPGVFAGAMLSAKTPDKPIRVLLGVMLCVSGLMLLDLSPFVAAGVAIVMALVGFAWLRVQQDQSAERTRVDIGSEGGSE